MVEIYEGGAPMTELKPCPWCGATPRADAGKGGEMSTEFQSFEPAVHVSGWTYLKCPFCFKRINIQENVAPLEKPESYGVENPTVVTHKALYKCRCGETQIIVEGTMQTMVLNGCFAFKKP